MSQFFSSKHYDTRTFVLLLVLIVGLIISRALISITTALLLVNLLLDEERLKRLQSFIKQPKFLAFAILPAIMLAYLPFAVNFRLGLAEIVQKLPLLFIPLAVASMTPQSKQVKALYSLFIVVALTSSFVVLINYLGHLEYYTELIKKGKSIPMPHNHIRYSLLLSFATILSFHLFLKKRMIQFKTEPYFYLFTSIFLFIVCHVFSVRSGLFTLYLGAFVYAIIWIINSKKWIVGFFALTAVLSVPALAYHTIPSFNNRIDYMVYDWQQFKKGNIGHNSDARRLRSYEIGWKVAKNELFFGAGLGSVEKVIGNEYVKQYPQVEEKNRILPHNQFLWTLIEIGIFGLIALLVMFLCPVFYTSILSNPLYLVFTLIIAASCMVEATLETQIGLTFFALFSSLLLLNPKHED